MLEKNITKNIIFTTVLIIFKDIQAQYHLVCRA